jgi:hypothetical protein
MTKMPLNYYGYYSLLDPFAAGYYKVGEKEKARNLLEQLMPKYKENLKYYSNLKPTEQSYIMIDIITDIERYRGLLEVMKEQGDMQFYKKNALIFNSYNQMFERFGRENEGLKKQESNSFTEKDSLEEIDTLISPDSIPDSIKIAMGFLYL